MTADAVAAAILRGIARGRFTIAPGLTLGVLAPLHSLVAPLLHRFWFDPLIARETRLTALAEEPTRKVPSPGAIAWPNRASPHRDRAIATGRTAGRAVEAE
jgi:hypothetical protein